MTTLDCETFDSTLRSIAAGAGVSEPQILRALETFDPNTIDPDADWDIAAPRAVLASIGININAVRFDAAYYFHGTRTLHPQAFIRDGILPLGQIIDRLWDDLHTLVHDQVTAAEWRAQRTRLENAPHTQGIAGHSAMLYQLKTSKSKTYLHGPYASLVKDHVVTPIEGHHDYLDSPEIVEDIARFLGSDLRARFDRAARSCVVKFRHHDVESARVGWAVSYLLGRVRNEPLGFASVGGVDCKGAAVPAHDVIAVDEIELTRRTDRARATVARHLPPT